MPSDRLYYHFMFNPLGTQREASWAPGRKGGNGAKGGAWDSSWQVKTLIYPDRWTAEIKIPFADLKVSPGSKDKWRLNIVRQTIKEETAVPEWSVIQVIGKVSKSSFHNVENFSFLMFE